MSHKLFFSLRNTVCNGFWKSKFFFESNIGLIRRYFVTCSFHISKKKCLKKRHLKNLNVLKSAKKESRIIWMATIYSIGKPWRLAICLWKFGYFWNNPSRTLCYDTWLCWLGYVRYSSVRLTLFTKRNTALVSIYFPTDWLT